MKVVVTHLYNNYTGSPLVLSQTLRALSDARIETDLYTSDGPGFLDDAPCTRHFLHWYRWSPNKYLRLINFTLSQIALFFRLLKYRNEEVVFFANTILPASTGWAAKWMGKRVIYHIHETTFQPPAFTAMLTGTIQRTADHLIFVSRYLQDYHEFPRIPQNVIFNALSADFVRKAQSAPQESYDGPLRVLMICSLKKAKGIFEYLELARRVPEAQFTLVISQTQSQIDRFLGAELIPANVKLYPAQTDVHPFYQFADCLVSLSHPIEWPETFGMTIVEGMQYGLPAIVPPVGAPVEIVRPGIDGFHADMRHLEEVELCLRSWIEDPASRKEMGQQARLRAGDFSVEVFAKQIVDTIQKVAQGPAHLGDLDEMPRASDRGRFNEEGRNSQSLSG
ncbi:glycosyltransferase family 4 protein [Pontibacter sp. G13]|uniref:glycosyltransferase family 4 protein n=1 Tax=Pontibacter sp. G13 TaxID=3074898 RepID=UPI00288A312C|nr:glycosyltransferase family 4 protein [Pontibacter sp. G13]WNJ19308.1 glycosyltransferase family 4 protein [Pontibacter sp. G13]